MGFALKKTMVDQPIGERNGLRTTVQGTVIGGSTMLAAQQSFAAAVDVADVVTDIGAQLVPIAAIGIAVLGVFVAVKAFQWVRRALA